MSVSTSGLEEIVLEPIDTSGLEDLTRRYRVIEPGSDPLEEEAAFGAISQEQRASRRRRECERFLSASRSTFVPPGEREEPINDVPERPEFCAHCAARPETVIGGEHLCLECSRRRREA